MSPLRAVQAGYVAAILLDAALVRLNLAMVVAFDPPMKPDDRNLRAMVNFLKDRPEAVEVRSDVYKKALTEGAALYARLESDERLVSLKHLRNKALAHRGVLDPVVPKVRYNDLFGFTREVSLVWEKLAFGTGHVPLPLASQIDAYRQYADAFWGRWET